jgi:ABC-type multidrug transport system fused ATPase/permease subunit
MTKDLLELFGLLQSRQKRKYLMLQILIILMSVGEVMGLLLLGSFISLISDINEINENQFIYSVYLFFEFKENQTFLIFFGGLVLILITITSLISILTIWRLSIFSAEIGAELSSRLFSFFMHKPWLFHTAANSSTLINKIAAECERVNSGIISPFMQLNAKLVLALFICIGLFIYQPLIALFIATVLSFAYVILFLTVRKKLTKNGEEITLHQGKRYKLMSEGFGGIKDLLLSKRQSYFIKNFNNASYSFSFSKAKNLILGQVPRYAIEMIAFSIIIILIILLIYFGFGEGKDIFPIISIYALAAIKLLPAMQQIYYSLSMIRGHLPGFYNMREDLYESKNFNQNLHEFSFSQEPNNVDFFTNEVRLQEVTFSYPGTDLQILKNVNITIPKNKLIGIVGPSGSGKSTLIDIFTGLIEPNTGSLLIDNKELISENKRLWQSNIGIVSQNIFLSDSSIASNIAFGLNAEDINYEQVNHAIKLSHLEDLVLTLPEGIESIVGERGIQLSGGQRQRLGIARALYNNSNILILDEATSSLDGITEKLIMQAIHDFMGLKTMILIAHRLSTVKECHLIYLLVDGKIEDSGSYKELLERNAIFQKMVENSS